MPVTARDSKHGAAIFEHYFLGEIFPRGLSLSRSRRSATLGLLPHGRVSSQASTGHAAHALCAAVFIARARLPLQGQIPRYLFPFINVAPESVISFEDGFASAFIGLILMAYLFLLSASRRQNASTRRIRKPSHASSIRDGFCRSWRPPFSFFSTRI